MSEKVRVFVYAGTAEAIDMDEVTRLQRGFKMAFPDAEATFVIATNDIAKDVTAMMECDEMIIGEKSLYDSDNVIRDPLAYTWDRCKHYDSKYNWELLHRAYIEKCDEAFGWK